jgi:hypothetical protein
MMNTIKNNKPLVITVAVAILIILAVILIPRLTQRQEPTLNDLLNNAGLNGSSLDENLGNYTNNGSSASDIAACIASCETYLGNAGGISCETACRASAEFESDDVNDCGNLKGILQTGCITEKARDQRMPEYCEQIDAGSFRDTCYITVAEELNDISICNKITNNIYRQVCTQQF